MTWQPLSLLSTKRNFHAGTKEDISKNVQGSMYITEKETLTQRRCRSEWATYFYTGIYISANTTPVSTQKKKISKTNCQVKNQIIESCYVRYDTIYAQPFNGLRHYRCLHLLRAQVAGIWRPSTGMVNISYWKVTTSQEGEQEWERAQREPQLLYPFKSRD